MAGWAVGLAAGATLALRDRFSASGFLPDVRKFGATYANYVGKPLSYVLATPERPDDADNPLRVVYGNEGAERTSRPSGGGSAAGGGRIRIDRGRHSDQPVPGHAARRAGQADRRRGDPRPETGIPARWPSSTNRAGCSTPRPSANSSTRPVPAGSPATTTTRTRRPNGSVTAATAAATSPTPTPTVSLLRRPDRRLAPGRRREPGHRPIERVLLRHPDVTEAAVYAVPDVRVGDQVMARGRRPGTGSGRLPPVPRRTGGPGAEAVAQVRAGGRRTAENGYVQGAQAHARRGTLELCRTGVVATAGTRRVHAVEQRPGGGAGDRPGRVT